METVIGRGIYRLPPGCRRLLRVCLGFNENCFMEMQAIPLADLMHLVRRSNEPLQGFPAYYAVADGEMILYPFPSQEWEIARTWESPEGHLVDAVRDTD